MFQLLLQRFWSPNISPFPPRDQTFLYVLLLLRSTFVHKRNPLLFFHIKHLLSVIIIHQLLLTITNLTSFFLIT